jgi:hypothetical protein
MKKQILTTCLLLAGCIFDTSAMAATPANKCSTLPTQAQLKSALTTVLADTNYPGGFHTPLWLTLVDASGVVCAVVHSLANGTDVAQDLQLAHRVLAVQKASTANAFSSSTTMGVSSGQLYSAGQPGGLLQGAVYESTIDPLVGDSVSYGTVNDPLVGKRFSGFTGIAGGLALFNSNKKKVGAIGIAGDTGCTSHVLAWRVRELLRNGAYRVANLPWGLSSSHDDKLIQDVTPNPAGGVGHSASGYGHILCQNNPTDANDYGSIEGN